MAMDVPPPEAVPETITSAAPGLLSGGRAISLVLLVVSVCFAVAGQLTLKSAMDEIGRIGGAEVRDPLTTIGRVIREPKLWLGLGIFGVSSVFWLVVLSRVALSVAYPMVGLSYIVVVAIARFFFHEYVPSLRWLGVSVIAVGIAIIGLSFRRATGA